MSTGHDVDRRKTQVGCVVAWFGGSVLCGGVLGWVVGWLGAVGECCGVRSFRLCKNKVLKTELI